MDASGLISWHFFLLTFIVQWVSGQEYSSTTGHIAFSEVRDNYYKELWCATGLEFRYYVSYGQCMGPTAEPTTEMVVDCQKGTYTYANGHRVACSTSTLFGRTTSLGKSFTGCMTWSFLEHEGESTASTTSYDCYTEESTITVVKTLVPGDVYLTRGADVPLTVPGGSTAASALETTFPTVATEHNNPGARPDTSYPILLQPQYHPRSKAWIAGAVVGPTAALMVGICSIAGILRYRKRRKAETAGLLAPAVYPTQSPPQAKQPMDMTPLPMVPVEAMGYHDAEDGSIYGHSRHTSTIVELEAPVYAKNGSESVPRTSDASRLGEQEP
ncbi:hypothetical protein EJ05DRAFT_515117 [Pseudovirgaria hyperparasitica]|uniref:Mid2 domain-containing protein n=1 Tax=Pseudovirgaria hyperparasitica TaxID=470096 RepID=A0A6A6VR26_9PEZI|nr:uncharacterized protein EJ05DRAFT_515117 [Pseudovirgaria hyperparasitica]KAF2753118.1 hypothetical protein EJ05DRAFT_515117 [Pseudovirgaria hyperparasitica]